MDQAKDFLGRGWAMPMSVDPYTGTIAMSEYEDDIRQSILIILETAKGERVMRPDFGCGIHDLVFEAVDTTTLERIRSEVDDALRRFEARIDVLDITVDEDATIQGELLVQVEYNVRRTNQVGNLVFPFYYVEGGQP